MSSTEGENPQAACCTSILKEDGFATSTVANCSNIASTVALRSLRVSVSSGMKCVPEAWHADRVDVSLLQPGILVK